MEDVSERLIDAGIDASDVDVSVKQGVVTLSGEVRARHDKHRIEQIAADSSGVCDVENQLRIKKTSGSSSSSSSSTGGSSWESDSNKSSTTDASSGKSGSTGMSGAVGKANESSSTSSSGSSKKY